MDHLRQEDRNPLFPPLSLSFTFYCKVQYYLWFQAFLECQNISYTDKEELLLYPFS